MLTGVVRAQENRLVSTDLKSTGYFIGTTFRTAVTPQINREQGRHVWGIGFYYSVTDGDEETAGAPEIEDKNGNGYSLFGFSWGIWVYVSCYE